MRFQKQIQGELNTHSYGSWHKEEKTGGIVPVEINSNIILTEDEVLTH